MKRPIYEVRLKDGRRLTGQCQGRGGEVPNDWRLHQVISQCLGEEMAAAERRAQWPTLCEGKDAHSVDDSLIFSVGAFGIQSLCRVKHAGDMFVWTDPNNEHPADRGVAFKASELRAVFHQGQQVYPPEEEE